MTAAAQQLDLTIMIPAYREAASLRTLLPQIHAAVRTLGCAYEVLVIDTLHPTDDTAEVCQQMGATHLRRSGGNSYGDALRTGIAQARGRHVLCMDADGSHNPAYFALMWAKREVWDIVIGSRYVRGGHTENPAILIFLSYLVNLTFRIVFRLSAHDVTNSFRLYRAEILRPIRLQSNDFDILEELLIKAVTQRPPASVGEVPVTFERRKAGESKRHLFRFALGYFATLRRLRAFQRQAQQEQLTVSNAETL